MSFCGHRVKPKTQFVRGYLLRKRPIVSGYVFRLFGNSIYSLFVWQPRVLLAQSPFLALRGIEPTKNLRNAAVLASRAIFKLPAFLKLAEAPHHLRSVFQPPHGPQDPGP